MCGPQLRQLQKSDTEPIACVVAFSPRASSPCPAPSFCLRLGGAGRVFSVVWNVEPPELDGGGNRKREGHQGAGSILRMTQVHSQEINLDMGKLEV